MVREDLCPVDLAAVQADDVFLDLLGSNGQVSDDELARVLVAWCRDAGSEPAGELVNTDIALAAARKSYRSQRGLSPDGLLGRLVLAVSRRSAPYRAAGLGFTGGTGRCRLVRHRVVTIAAVLVIAFSVAGLLSLHSQPGDLLWPLHELLYSTDGE